MLQTAVGNIVHFEGKERGLGEKREKERRREGEGE